MLATKVTLLLVAGLLCRAAFSKLRNRDRFAIAVRSWSHLTADRARGIAFVLPLVEMTLAVMLAAGAVGIGGASARVAGTGATALLFFCFCVGQLWIMVARRAATCGCGFGASRVGVQSVSRTAFFLAAVAVAGFGQNL